MLHATSPCPHSPLLAAQYASIMCWLQKFWHAPCLAESGLGREDEAMLRLQACILSSCLHIHVWTLGAMESWICEHRSGLG